MHVYQVIGKKIFTGGVSASYIASYIAVLAIKRTSTMLIPWNTVLIPLAAHIL